jgi:hypothetical protein
MSDKYTDKDYEARNVFVEMSKGTLEDIGFLSLLITLVEEYCMIKDELSEDIAKILLEVQDISFGDSNEVTLSKIQKMYDSLKALDSEF